GLTVRVRAQLEGVRHVVVAEDVGGVVQLDCRHGFTIMTVRIGRARPWAIPVTEVSRCGARHPRAPSKVSRRREPHAVLAPRRGVNYQMARNVITTDVALVGAGIMSATLGTLLRKLEPSWSISVFEALDAAAAE